MAFVHTRVKSAYFQPAAVGTAETKNVLPYKKGDRILGVHIERIIGAAASTTSTVAVQASTGAAGGLLAATDTEGSAGSLVNGAGSDLAASGGFLAAADGNIQVDYAIGATPGATNPKIRVVVEIARPRKSI